MKNIILSLILAQTWGKYRPKCAPGELARTQNYKCPGWPETLHEVCNWAKRLKKEIEAPDLWAEIEKYRPTFSLTPPKELVNEPIPAFEADEVRDKLKTLEAKMQEEFQLSSEDRQFVHSKLDYLADAVRRQGRLDWVHTSIGVFITIAFTVLSIDQARSFWALIQQLLGAFPFLLP